MAGLLAILPATPASAAYTTGVASNFSGLGCSGNNTVSGWGSSTAPPNAVSIQFTITGGGGSAGDNQGGNGGGGGKGATIVGSVAVTPGQVIWAKIGCGGTDGTSNADGWATGKNRSNVSGGGGGASALCIGTSATSCSGGTVVVVAGGGGGGGRGAGSSGCNDQTGAGGGSAGGGTGVSSAGGTGYSGGGGGNGTGDATVTGGGGGTNTGGGGATGTGLNNTGENGFPGATPPTPGGATGDGGLGSTGNNNTGGGGGGGGYGGGGGGGGGRNSCSIIGGDRASGGGGGAGSSWVRNTVTHSAPTNAAATGGCTVNTINNQAGNGAGSGNQSYGCGGGLTATYTTGTPPTGANQTTGTATKGVPLGIALANADGEGNNRTCQIVSSPGKGSVTLSGGAPGIDCTASYTANANTTGNDTFTYRLVDSDGLASTSTYTVTIPIGNRAPTGADLGVGPINKGVGTPVALANTDPDGDSPLTCAVVTGPAKAVIGGGTSCAKTITPNANTVGADSFTYTVSDAHSGTSATYTVTFTIVNRVPAGTNQTLSTDAGSGLAINLANTDPDLVDTLTCVTAAGPTKGVLTGAGCARTYTSNAGTANNGIGGTDSFTYTPQDQNGGIGATQTIGITIRNPDLSLLKSHSGRFQPGTGTGTYTLTVANTANSVANGTSTIVDTLPAGMRYRSSGAGTSGFTCTGTAGVSTTVTCTRATAIPVSFSGSLTIVVDVAENAATPVDNSAVLTNLYELSSTAANNTAVDATVVNIRPVANSVTASTAVDTPVSVALSATDANGDVLTYAVVSPPANGSLSGVGASRQYSPDTGYQGIDTFTYRVTDPDGLVSNTATATIYVGVSRFVGTVTNEVGGAALPGITVFLIDNSSPAAADPAVVATTTTNGAGAYDLASQFPSLGAVPYGSYTLRFYDATNNFISEFHTNAPNRASATNIVVSSASPTITIDAALTPGARIQGTVRSTAGAQPTINGIQVRLYKIGTAGSKAATTSGAGQYKHELLTAGQYQLWFRDVNSGQWISEWYDEQTSQATAVTVNLTVGQQLIIDEDLVPIVAPPAPTTGTVTGTVRSAGMGNGPLAGIQVRLYSGPTYESSKAATTDAIGQYTFTDVLSGSYKLWFRVVQGSAYASEYFDDEADLASADPINVTVGTVVADALLTPAAPPAAPNTAVVSGRVTELDGVTPIVGLQVRLYAEGVATGSVATTTDGNGNYSFTGRAPGSFQVWFRDLSGAFFSEWNLDQASQPTADPVAASNGSTTTVNAALVRR